MTFKVPIATPMIEYLSHIDAKSYVKMTGCLILKYDMPPHSPSMACCPIP